VGEARDHGGRRPREVIPASIDDLQALLARERYVADRSLATSLFIALKLQRPLLLEGEAGVGKTEVARALAFGMTADLIRLQCYEGLDISHAVYEWNYARQLLEIRLMEASGEIDRQKATAELFSDAFLIRRPLLQALSAPAGRPPVLLIDELDRADEEFEGYLLELLSDYQVTIPELGTIRAKTPPIVIITSNRTRELHDALKRRCLYHWIDYPDFDKELAIVTAKVPQASARLAAQVTAFVQELRTAELYKAAGVSETLDWVAALVALDRTELDAAAIEHTLGVLLKNQEDLQAIRGERIQDLLNRSIRA
jgi:MoxR-like ATPase